MPRSIDAAIKLMYVGALIAGVRLILDLIRLISIDLFTAPVFQAAVGAYVTMVFDAIAIALWCWPPRYAARGQSYSRTLASLLLSAGVVFFGLTLISPPEYADIYDVMIGAVELVTGAAAVWQLHLPDSTRYFTRMEAKKS
ncbi:MAG: hypothetical protein ABI137_11130 [Antricoccus sp.]